MVLYLFSPTLSLTIRFCISTLSQVAHNHLSDPKAMDRAYSNNGVHNEKFDEEHKIEHVTQ